MYLNSVPVLFLIMLICCTFAGGEPQATAGSQTTASGTAAVSTTISSNGSPTSTSTADEIYERIDISLDGKIFPPSISSGDITIPQDISINCVDCAINGSISLSAGGSIDGYDIPAPSDVMEMSPNFNFGDYWVGATFDSLDATFEFGINLTASTANNAFIVPINTTTISRTFGLLTLTAAINTEIHGWLNTSNDVNLTYGFKFSVPPGSEILVDLEHIDQSLSLGFNESKLEPIPLSSTTSDLDIGVELSFRPSVTFLASLGIADVHADVQLAVTLDVPKLDVAIKQVHNVNSTCDPASPSLPSDQVYQNLTLLVPSIGFDAFEVFTETGKVPGLKLQANQPFSQTESKNITTACYFFDAAKNTLGSVPMTKPTDTSSATNNYNPPVGFFTAIAIAVLIGM